MPRISVFIFEIKNDENSWYKRILDVPTLEQALLPVVDDGYITFVIRRNKQPGEYDIKKDFDNTDHKYLVGGNVMSVVDLN